MQIIDIINKDNPDLIIALSYLLDKNKTYIYLNPKEKLDPNIESKIEEIEEKLKEDYPLQYAIGIWEFYGLNLKVDERALIPRFETEILVDEIIKADIENKEILDIGTGSGAISLALAKNLVNSHITGVDIDRDSLDLAKTNAKRLNIKNVDFIYSDVFSNVSGKFDIIVSNPPYINTLDYNNLDKKLFYEPKKALVGGVDGLDFYRQIIKESKDYLNDEGYLFFEIGYDQKIAVNDLLIKSDFKNIKNIEDYNGLDRVVIGQKG